MAHNKLYRHCSYYWFYPRASNGAVLATFAQEKHNGIIERKEAVWSPGKGTASESGSPESDP